MSCKVVTMKCLGECSCGVDYLGVAVMSKVIRKQNVADGVRTEDLEEEIFYIGPYSKSSILGCFNLV
jgi:hypothetical protein